MFAFYSCLRYFCGGCQPLPSLACNITLDVIYLHCKCLENSQTAEHDIFIEGVEPTFQYVESLHEGLLGRGHWLSSASGWSGRLTIYLFIDKTYQVAGVWMYELIPLLNSSVIASLHSFDAHVVQIPIILGQQGCCLLHMHIECCHKTE